MQFDKLPKRALSLIMEFASEPEIKQCKPLNDIDLCTKRTQLSPTMSDSATIFPETREHIYDMLTRVGVKDVDTTMPLYKLQNLLSSTTLNIALQNRDSAASNLLPTCDHSEQITKAFAAMESAPTDENVALRCLSDVNYYMDDNAVSIASITDGNVQKVYKAMGLSQYTARAGCLVLLCFMRKNPAAVMSSGGLEHILSYMATSNDYRMQHHCLLFLNYVSTFSPCAVSKPDIFTLVMAAKRAHPQLKALCNHVLLAME
jgi:hypothetical protein